MKYFKNTELATLYKVSEKSVRNWVDAAQQGKLDLQLFENRGKSFIANTSLNTTKVEALVQRGKKYKNSRGYKTVTPLPEFYEQYNAKQVFDIISSIDIYREVPYKYSFFGAGAHHWDAYTYKLMADGEVANNSLTNTRQLLAGAEDYILNLVGDSRVNIIDIGVGNAIPVEGLIKTLVAHKKLKRYLCVDISHEMIKIAEQNVRKWLDNDAAFEGHVRDIIYDRVNDLITADSMGEGPDSVVNIVLLVGGTVQNMRQTDHALTNIHDSMGRNDLFIVSRGLDSQKSRRYFDFVTDSGGPNNNFRGRTTLDLLGIDESLYSIKTSFDETTMTRKLEIQLKVALSIAFEFDGQTRRVTLDKDTRLLLWRVNHQDILDTVSELCKNDLEPVVATKSLDAQYVQVISKIKAVS